MILFFDTETSGKADFRSAPDAAHQPRLVQLAAILTDDSGKEMSCLNCIIKPHGFEIPVGASSVHGITTEMARDYGVNLESVLPVFAELASKPQIIVAHNVEFDLFVMTGEYLRGEYEDIPMNGASHFCTMKHMTGVCKLPGNYGDWKWPRLQEAYRHAFASEFDGAHDALSDVRACAKIYWWLKAQKGVTQ